MPLSRFRLAFAVCACCLFWAFLGGLIGAIFRGFWAGLVLGLLLGIGYTLLGYWASEKFALDSVDAHLLDAGQAPHLSEMMQELCSQVEMEVPFLYAVPGTLPNAFVTARRDGKSALAVTHGLTQALEAEEVRAVVAVMVARLASGQMAAWTVGATLAGVPLHWAYTGTASRPQALLLIFAYPGAALLRLVYDPGATLAADHHAAHLIGSPQTLGAALGKIESALAAAPPIINPALALLFAVPPASPPSPLGTVASRPTVAERQAALSALDVGAALSTGSMDEEAH